MNNQDDHLINLRKSLNESFNDEDFILFCYENFPEVYKRFNDLPTRRQKIKHLIDYCQRKSCLEQINALLGPRSNQQPPSQAQLASGPSPAPASGTSSDAQRCADLSDNIQDTLSLIKDYEEQRRLADDPRTRRRAERNIAQLREELIEYQAEVEQLGCE